MTETVLSLKDGVLLLQAALVLGGGFYFAGRLGAKLDALAETIERLRESFTSHVLTLQDMEVRIVRIEERIGTPGPKETGH
jgi:hypothetical protein